MSDILIAGVDEVGRGCIAGPMFAVAALFRCQNTAPWPIEGVRDSKEFKTIAHREVVFHKILDSDHLVDFGIGEVSADEIDEMGIDPANELAFQRAVWDLDTEPHELIVDGTKPVEGWSRKAQTVEPRADSRYWQTGAASIIAKVIRDRFMCEMHRYHPVYDWLNNMGYGTPSHIRAVQRHGVTAYHRKRFVNSALKSADNKHARGPAWKIR